MTFLTFCFLYCGNVYFALVKDVFQFGFLFECDTYVAVYLAALCSFLLCCLVFRVGFCWWRACYSVCLSFILFGESLLSPDF